VEWISVSNVGHSTPKTHAAWLITGQERFRYESKSGRSIKFFNTAHIQKINSSKYFSKFSASSCSCSFSPSSSSLLHQFFSILKSFSCRFAAFRWSPTQSTRIIYIQTNFLGRGQHSKFYLLFSILFGWW